MSKSKGTQQPKLTDEQIVELYWDRNEKAISETNTKYGNMLFSIAYNILYDSLDCEECKNDTYFKMWNKLPPSRPARLSTFASKIMRDVAIDRYREKASQRRIPSELTVSMEELQGFLLSTSNPEAEYEAKEVSEFVSEYLRSLTRRQRYVFFARFYSGKSMEQIACEYGVSTATVCREISKIKQGLKSHLERSGVYL